jgi:hypothetical protein
MWFARVKLPLMDHRPDTVDEATRAALPRPGRRDAWLEQRLHFLIGEQVRLKADLPLRRFLRGARAAYRRFLLSRPTPPTASTAGRPFTPLSRGVGSTRARESWS